jgi:ubiquinone/menaquinone biosynthesis C-methylase UbiE
MAAWFRKGLSPHHTAIAMIGAKAGDRVLVVGAADPDLAAEVALVTGLNGTTIVSDADAGARERVDLAARKAGALVEFAVVERASLPFPDGSQDVVVMTGAAPASGVALEEAVRVLRQAGRIIILEGTRAAGGLFRSRTPLPRRPADDVLATLERAGTRARRQLADVDGVAYYEARK